MEEILSCERFNIMAINGNSKKHVMTTNKNETEGNQKQKLQV